MLQFLAEQADYLSAVIGLLFALAGMAAMSLRPSRQHNVPWGWLAAYLMLQSLESLLDLLFASFAGASSWVLAGRLMLRAVSNILLLEFCRQGFGSLGRRVPGPWVLAVPVAVVGAGSLGGLEILDGMSFLFLGAPAKVLGGLLFWQLAGREPRFGNYLRRASAAFFLLIIPSLWRVGVELVVPEARLTPDWVAPSRILPTDMVRCVLALLLTTSIWSYSRFVRIARLPDPSLEGFRKGARVAGLALAGVVAMGWVATAYLGSVANEEKRGQVVQLASASSSTFSGSLFKGLTGTPSDLNNPLWERIHSRCQGIGDAAKDVRYVYAFGQRTRGGPLFFFVDTEPNIPDGLHGDEPTATPGDVYDDPAAKVFARVFETGRPVSLPPYRDKWGSFVSAGAPIRDESGAVVAVLGIDVDARVWAESVAAQRLAPILLTLVLALIVAILFSGYQRHLEDQRRLAFSEMSLRTVFDHVDDAIIVHNAGGTILDVNRRMLEMWGVTREQALQSSLAADLSSSSAPTSSLPKIWENIMAGEEAHMEWLCRRPTQGGEFWGALFMTRMERSDGPVIVATVRDITRRKNIEEQLRLAMARAEGLAERADAANRAKSTFLANMSHEIRTPLNGVLGMTRLLLESDMPPSIREYVEIANRSGEHLLQVLNDILDFSKIEAGKLTVDQVPFDLTATVEDAAALTGVRAIANGLSFACIVHHDVPSGVLGDPVRIRQILSNLLANAVKFTEKGEIVVEVSRLAGGDESTAMLRFSVRDTGPGIPPESIEGLFQPFYQLDSATFRQYGGTGLGLSVCRRLVELMRGTIQVQSQAGGGTEFFFDVPFRILSDTFVGIPAITAPQESSVVVLSGHAATATMLQLQLDRVGFMAEAAMNGEELRDAVARATSEPYKLAALVVDLDVEPPVISDAVRWLGATLGEKSPPLVLLGRPHQVVAPRLRSKSTVVLTKPVRRMQLARAVLAAAEGKPGEMNGAEEAANGNGDGDAAAQEPPRSLKILVAEDNQANQKVAEGLLKKLGHQALIVSDGRQALQALAKQRYDLVLMDCQMPVLDGYEATRRVRFGPEKVTDRHIPIVAMTAHAFREERERCLASGMDDHLSKPVKLEDLDRVLKRWVRGKSVTPQPQTPVVRTPDAVFDRAELEDRLMSDWRLIRKVVEASLRELPLHIEGLGKALAEGNAEQVVHHAHSAKGVAATLGAQTVRSHALEIERLGKEGKLAQAAEMMPALHEYFSVLRETVTQFLEHIPKTAHKAARRES